MTSRTQSKKWETDLSSKVRTYRESEKSWTTQEESLKFELQRTQSDYEQLKTIVEKAEAEQLKAQQRTRALEYELEDYSNLRRDLEAAQEKIMMLDDQKKELHTLIQERNDLRNDLEIANMRLNSREQERERSIKAYERRIMELETRLQMADRSASKPGQLPSSVQQMLDSALAASDAKVYQLKKAHLQLIQQHTDLQMKYYDLEGERQAEQNRYQVQQKLGQLEPEKMGLSRNSSMSNRHTNTNSRYQPSLSAGERPSEEQEQTGFPSTMISSGTTSPARSQRAPKPTTPSPYPGFGGGLGPDFSASYDVASNQLQAQRPNFPPNSSSQSNHSVETEGSINQSQNQKEKVAPKSEVRVYGRGKPKHLTCARSNTNMSQAELRTSERRSKIKTRRSLGHRSLEAFVVSEGLCDRIVVYCVHGGFYSSHLPLPSNDLCWGFGAMKSSRLLVPLAFYYHIQCDTFASALISATNSVPSGLARSVHSISSIKASPKASQPSPSAAHRTCP